MLCLHVQYVNILYVPKLLRVLRRKRHYDFALYDCFIVKKQFHTRGPAYKKCKNENG